MASVAFFGSTNLLPPSTFPKQNLHLQKDPHDCGAERQLEIWPGNHSRVQMAEICVTFDAFWPAVINGGGGSVLLKTSRP